MLRLEFLKSTMEMALTRQKNHCASCGEIIYTLGVSGRGEHRFGEVSHAHHIEHAKFGGSNAIENCVVICQSCHYSAHEGGNYRDGTVRGKKDDFPYYTGCVSPSCPEHSGRLPALRKAGA
jgi:5-methylcytosine-specific restriction endonuclease McrA